MKERKLLDFFFPPKCMLCRKVLPGGTDFLCEDCLRSLPQPAFAELPGGGMVRAPLRYEGAARDALIRFKFGGCRCYAGGMASLLLPLTKAAGAEVITFVPVSERRRRSRGYDQTRLLAEELSTQSGIPWEPMLVKAHTKRQSAAGGREERRKNISGAFSLKEGAAVPGRRIILLDDICTTGATLSEAAGVLRSAGAAEITALALALTEKQR